MLLWWLFIMITFPFPRTAISCLSCLSPYGRVLKLCPSPTQPEPDPTFRAGPGPKIMLIGRAGRAAGSVCAEEKEEEEKKFLFLFIFIIIKLRFCLFTLWRFHYYCDNNTVSRLAKWERARGAVRERKREWRSDSEELLLAGTQQAASVNG